MEQNIPISGVVRQLLLHDGGIRRAIQRGEIVITPEVERKQFQSATLDARVGKVRVYGLEAREKILQASQRRGFLDADTADEFAKVFPDELGRQVDIPSGAFAEIFLHDSIEIDPEKHYISIDLRSTFGRFGLQIANPFLGFDLEGGKRYVSVRNHNVNPLRVYCGDRFAQVFFHPASKGVPHDGYVVNDPDEASELAKKVCESPAMIGPYMQFFVGDEVLKFKEGLGVIDTRRKYSKNELFNVFETNQRVFHNLHDAVIVQLDPRIDLPDDIGIKLLNQIPCTHEIYTTKPSGGFLFLESHRARATWADPGFKGKLSAHPWRFKLPGILERGMPFALGVFFKYNTPVGNAYGSEALGGSHYQNSNSGSPNV